MGIGAGARAHTDGGTEQPLTAKAAPAAIVDAGGRARADAAASNDAAPSDRASTGALSDVRRGDDRSSEATLHKSTTKAKPPPTDEEFAQYLRERAPDLYECGASEQSRMLSLTLGPAGGITVRVDGEIDAGLLRCIRSKFAAHRLAPFSGPPVVHEVNLTLGHPAAVKPPAYTLEQAGSIFDEHRFELRDCGGDKSDRMAHVVMNPNGSMQASASPEDFAAKCLATKVATWKGRRFDGAEIDFDIPVILGR